MLETADTCHVAGEGEQEHGLFSEVCLGKKEEENRIKRL